MDRKSANEFPFMNEKQRINGDGAGFSLHICHVSRQNCTSFTPI